MQNGHVTFFYLYQVSEAPIKRSRDLY